MLLFLPQNDSFAWFVLRQCRAAFGSHGLICRTMLANPASNHMIYRATIHAVYQESISSIKFFISLLLVNMTIQPNGTSAHDDSNGQHQPYTVLEEPLGTTRHLRIVTIGAGISGLNMIRALRKTMSNYEHVVYEKNPEVGGTWYENRYPGCQCDHPSHNYQFTWKPNPRWSQFSANGPEIQEYILRCCEEENMRPEIKTSHQIVGTWWDDAASKWSLKIRNLVTGAIVDDHCDFLLNATGILK